MKEVIFTASLLEEIVMKLFTAMSEFPFIWHQIQADISIKFLLSAAVRKCLIAFMEDM